MSRYAEQMERVLELIEYPAVHEYLQEGGLFAPDSAVAALVAFADEQTEEK